MKSFFNQGKKPARRKTAKTRHPRVSTEDVISGLWDLLGLMAKPVSVPMSKAIRAEAPVAGMLLDDAVQGTFADKVLQPFARVESSGKVFAALALPPVLVGLIDMRPDKAEVIVPALRKSLRLWVDVAGPKIEELKRREEEFQATYGQQIDEMILDFFAEKTDIPEEAQ